MSMCSTYCCMFEWNIGVKLSEGGDNAETRSSLVVEIIHSFWNCAFFVLPEF